MASQERWVFFFFGIFTYSECVKVTCDVREVVLHQKNRAGRFWLEQKVLSLRHVWNEAPRLKPNRDTGFASALKIRMKTSGRSGSTKSGVTPFVASAPRTRVLVTPLSAHVGRGYVLHPGIDINCHLKAEMIPARPAVGQIYTDARITGKALAACRRVKVGETRIRKDISGGGGVRGRVTIFLHSRTSLLLIFLMVLSYWSDPPAQIMFNTNGRTFYPLVHKELRIMSFRLGSTFIWQSVVVLLLLCEIVLFLIFVHVDTLPPWTLRVNTWEITRASWLLQPTGLSKPQEKNTEFADCWCFFRRLPTLKTFSNLNSSH